jgi:hypothetical protein
MFDMLRESLIKSEQPSWFFHSHRGFSPVLSGDTENPKTFKRFSDSTRAPNSPG